VQYYAENWSKLIMQILRYRNPLVANAHMMTSITNTIDPTNKVYFHIDWLKPGRHTFLIQHDNNEITIDDEVVKPIKRMAGLFGLKKPSAEPEKPKLKKSTANFYVHDMLASFRTDPIPECKYLAPLNPLIFTIHSPQRTDCHRGREGQVQR